MSLDRGSIQLGHHELTALAWLVKDHKLDQLNIQHIRDKADVGWLHVQARRRMRGTTLMATDYWVVSPTGRVWVSNEDWERLNQIRDASYAA